MAVLRVYHVQLFLMKGTSKQGGTPVDTDIDDSRVDPPENHAVGEPGNVHTDSHLKSPADHD